MTNKTVIENVIPLLGDPQHQTIVDLTDGDSNRVMKVNERYVYKEFFSQTQLSYETTGCLMFNLLSSYGVPMLLDKGQNYLVTEFVESESCFKLHHDGEISREEVGRKVIMFMAEVYWKYRFFNRDKVRLFPHMAWEERFQLMLNRIDEIRSGLEQVLNSQQLMRVDAAVSSLKQLEVPVQSLTFLHRDLHLDNVLVKKGHVGRDRNFFIDFEHCMEGPIEFELQNSIFWHDDWSLPYELVRSELKSQHDIPYSDELEYELVSLYYLDQLYLAYDKADYEKVRTLSNIYSSHRQ